MPVKFSDLNDKQKALIPLEQRKQFTGGNVLAAQTFDEAQQHNPLACESDLHDKIADVCKQRGWIALHGRMDMATGRTIGEPDFTILADHGRTIYIEAKSKTGKRSQAQLALAVWAAKLGHTIHVCRTMADVMAAIEK